MGFLNYGSEQEVFDKLHELTLAANKTVQELLLVVQQFHSGEFKDMKGLMLKADEAETATDDAKKEIRKIMAAATFLPNFRQDVLELTNMVEHIADASETNAKFFYITEKLMKKNHSKIPQDAKDAILRLTEYGVELSKKAAEAIGYLPENVDAIRPLAKEIGDKQDEANALELNVLRTILDSSIDGFLKAELIDAVRMSGNLADRCNAAVHILTYMVFTDYN